MKLSFDHPTIPPGWLGRWIGRGALDRLVPAGLRQYALELGAKERIRSLDWDDATLRLLVGSQRCIWELQPDDTWKVSCTCGYPKPHCAHAFLAGYLFESVKQHLDWQNSAPLFTHQAESRHPELLRPQNPAPSESPSRIEIEADFHHRPGSVAVRIYHVENDMRNLLSMQRVYNLAMRIRYSDRAGEVWPDAERAFLKWVAGELKSRPELKKNLNLLNFTPGRFQRWTQRWADSGIRLIERSGQREIGAKTGPAKIEILAFDEQTHLRLAAQVVPVSGTPIPFTEVFKSMQSGQREPMINGHPTELDTGLSWRALCELFGAKDPRIAKEHVEQHLATVLEGRLDLLHGTVITFQDRMTRAQVEARSDGAETVVVVTLDGQPLIRDCLAAFHPPRRNGNGFQIVRLIPEDRDALARFLDQLDARPDSEAPAAVRIAGRDDAVKHLAQAWNALPDCIDKRHDASLASLLTIDSVKPTPELTIHDRGVFFNVVMQWRIGDAVLRHDALHAAIASNRSIVRGDSGRWIRLAADWAGTILETAADCGFGRNGRRRMFLPEAQELVRKLDGVAPDEPRTHASAEALTRLRNTTPPPLPALPEALEPVLRPYQRAGFDFLADRQRHGIGVILADDMGLGKTLQALALLQAVHRQFANLANSDRARHSLVICPASVLSVWVSEAEKFAPDLRFRLHRGSADERRNGLKTRDFDVLLVNYALVRQDIDLLSAVRFDIVILDEAQRIKNPEAQVTDAVKRLQVAHRIALTGTPLENHPLDLWSIMDFLNPGYLGDRAEFANTDLTKEDTERLARNLMPVMLRRTKRMVAPELPERIEETILIELGDEERAFYERLRKTGATDLSGKGTMDILALLTRLRQACCAPALVPGGQGLPSTKIDVCLDLVDELVDEGHSVLVFSQFVQLLELLGERLDQNGVHSWRITGDTPVDRRPAIVQEFTDAADPGVMLLSLRAAGTGLTLTKADYVILFDPWWNPAVENQAIDRTHRIGQKRNVIAYRLVASETVEEAVQTLQAAKRELFNAVVEGASSAEGVQLSRDVLEQILLA